MLVKKKIGIYSAVKETVSADCSSLTVLDILDMRFLFSISNYKFWHAHKHLLTEGFKWMVSYFSFVLIKL